MNRTAQDLRWALNSLNGQIPLNQAHVTYILAKCRQLLETIDDGIKFEVLRMYSNWTLHSELDRGSNLQGLLRKVVEAIECGPQKLSFQPPLLNTNDLINQIIGFAELRREIKFLLESCEIETTFFQDKFAWTEFVQFLCREIMEKPLLVKGELSIDFKKNRSLDLVDPGNPPPMQVKALQITGLRGDRFKWHLLGSLSSDEFHILAEGPLVFTEGPEAFSTVVLWKRR